VRLFLAEARRSSPHYRLYLTLILTALRPCEGLGLHWSSVELECARLTVRTTFSRLGRQQIWGNTKTHQVYTLSLPDVLVCELRALREEQAVSRRVMGSGFHDQDLVFCQPTGSPLHEHNLSQRDFLGVLRRAGLPRIRLYDLRHCHATFLAHQGTPVSVTQRRLGHTDPTTTLRYYIHDLPDLQKDAADRLATRLLGHDRDPEDSRG
jgi:integrase